MKKRVFIIHGWEGNLNSNWFPWLKFELESHGFEVQVPQMPNANFPKQSEWIEYLREIIGEPNENTFLIGHSLGVIAILRYLETFDSDQKIGGAILVAGFSESLGIIPEIENFFEKPVKYEEVKSACKKIVVFNSDDDPYVPIAKGMVLQHELDAEFIILHGAGHINMGTGDFEFPEAMKELLKISN